MKNASTNTIRARILMHAHKFKIIHNLVLSEIELHLMPFNAISQEVSPRLPTAAARTRSQVISC
jgi:hypothetical protein